VIVTFAMFGTGVLAEVPEISMLFSVISVIGIASLLLAALLKKEGFISSFVKE